MAFSFFGVFTTSQWDEFVNFVSIQRVELTKRKAWLSAQLSRNGLFVTNYDETTNFPTQYDPETGEGGFSCSPVSSYGAKLLAAYRMLGGVPENDMLLRTSDKPVFLTRGVNTSMGDGGQKTGYSDVYSNGRRDRGGMRFDRDLGNMVDAVKRPFLESTKHKREHLEYKIKRCLDLSDQLEKEISLIDKLLGDGEGSLDALLSKVSLEMSTSSSFNVIDNNEDRFGLGIGRVGDLAFDDSSEEAESEEMRVPR
jgi:hypothetical protein